MCGVHWEWWVCGVHWEGQCVSGGTECGVQRERDLNTCTQMYGLGEYKL